MMNTIKLNCLLIINLSGKGELDGSNFYCSLSDFCCCSWPPWYFKRKQGEGYGSSGGVGMTNTPQEVLEKCTPFPDGYAASLCGIMQRVAQRQYGRAGMKGILRNTCVTIPEGTPLGEKITASSGEFTGKGNCIVLNLCPFCGGKLRDF
jgi:hypothetical protein